MLILKMVAQFFGQLFELFVTERKSGLKNILCLISPCLLMGLGASGILYVSLRALQCSLPVALAVSVIFAAVTPGALFLSKYLRCFTLIFLISCGSQQGRNALITAGTGVVLFNCAQNSFHNLRGLVESLVCYLEDMRSSVRDLLAKYIEVINWIHQQIQKIPENKLVKFEDNFQIKHRIEDNDLKRNLNATRIDLEILGNYIISKFGTFSRVCKSAMAIMGILLVLILTWFYIRRYLNNIEFENIFVTNQFLQFDEKQKEEGKPHLLLLTRKEKKCFIKIPSLCLSEREWKSMARFFAPIFSNVCIWAVIIILDYGLFLLISSIRNHLDHLPTINITMNMKFNTETTFLNIPVETQAFTETFSDETHLSKGDCIPQPTLSITKIWIPLVALIAFLLLLTLISAKFTILKILVLSLFYAETEKDRIQFLHKKIVQKRSWAKLLSTEEALKFTTNRVSFWFPIFNRKQQKRITDGETNILPEL
ncbi:LOW QUALITY PROTEIN: dendritic cell-specific transmembrane protein-like [Heptranchias perlo]|uniref:LOW QUALITY PROTEIN: dendritic cell-specific transmembrane protein-like n=1 Tax=Heptranchias perlo TaxID=212740 RepID=UPI00355AB807